VPGDSPILVERRGAVALWTLDRPSTLNALSGDVLRGLGRLAREAARDASLRAVVLTGAGEKAFCAGADLLERRTMSEEQVLERLALYRSELGAIDACPKPVIAAVNGLAMGGGFELALCCDLRVAAPHAAFGLPETSLGIIPGAGGTQRLPRIVGLARAKELILLSRRLTAEEALAWGIVNRVAPQGVRVVEDTLEWIARIAAGAPLAQRAALEAIDRGLDVPLDVGLGIEHGCYESTLHTEDRREALAAFAEKRKPRFQGK
jgi:enoyl-CoA hydratase/carnithine racemase